MECVDSLRRPMQWWSQAALQMVSSIAARIPLQEPADAEPKLQHRTLPRYDYGWTKDGFKGGCMIDFPCILVYARTALWHAPSFPAPCTSPGAPGTPAQFHAGMAPAGCFLSEWSTWSECSATCGGGLSARNKTILQEPEPACPAGEQWRMDVRNITKGDCRLDNVEVSFCRGRCLSRTDVTLEEPYLQSVCDCCSYRLDPENPVRFLSLRCESGESEPVVLPIIHSCECTSCQGETRMISMNINSAFTALQLKQDSRIQQLCGKMNE
ncbi:unnamed protein product [Tetraodon nigroviridis]|uniref:(spotted green pufferfish) hypothetical protein n=1 Tax=Tetraodon nigroviridis TaxID=99883 RepID=Q4SKI6_TETNG|nr:unnamed protein product [Tetraodon nigroviridis]